MKKILMVVLLAIFWLLTIPAFAGWATQSGSLPSGPRSGADHLHGDSACMTQTDDRTAFGPTDFVIGKWHVDFTHHTFSVDDPGDRVIVVTKTTPDRSIRGGFLILNRHLISLSSFLRGDEILFQKVRFLKHRNRLTVFLRGTFGASVRIAVKETGSPVAPPQITLSADPLCIHSGESARLTWTSIHADSVYIDHGIGPADPDGSISVTPSETTTYTLTASHSGGSATAAATIQVIPGSLSIAITHPAQGEPFSTEFITVSGTVSRPDAAVWVNGVLATVSGTDFTAHGVTLVSGLNTIGALAQDGTDTAVAGVTVRLITAIDLAPVHVEIAALPAGDGWPTVSGQAMVTVANNGSSAVATPYRIVLFEDTNLSCGYEATEDNRLGQATMATGPGAGEATTIPIEFFGQLRFRDNRLHVCVDSDDEVKESDETNNITATQAVGVDLSASRLSVDDAGCPDGVILSVRLGNAGDASIPQGIAVAFYDGMPESGGVPIATVTGTRALDPGHYEDLTFPWTDPLPGTTFIYARADDDGTGTGSLSETDEANNLAFAEMTVCTAPLPPVDGIAGQVVDAVTGVFLAGTVVSLHGEENGTPGPIIDQTTTGEHGGFVFAMVDPGAYILTAALPGYINGERRLVLASGETLTHQDLALSPVLDPGQIRIVLTWGEHPADLEAHLTAPHPDGCRSHCFYWNDTISGARLDLDDRAAYGPETITISQRNPGTYRFYVHDFTNRAFGNSTALSDSGAIVTVYFGSNDPPATLTVPTGVGTVWHVFNLDGASGMITPIEKITRQEHPGRIDFPAITSTPVTCATYGEPYLYQIEAEDPDLDTLVYSLIAGPEGMHLDPFSGQIRWTPTGGQGGWQRVEIRAGDGRCGADTQAFEIAVDYLPVVDFAVEPCSGINPGGEIILTWQTDRAETVVIDQGIGEASASGTMRLSSPDRPIPFTLTAVNAAGQIRRIVPEHPVINGFTAGCVPSTGATTRLTWASDCASSCAIDQAIGPVSTSGSTVVTPPALPGEYTLTCANAAGLAAKRVVVRQCPSSSADLSASPGCDWSPGDPVTLAWATGGVDDCSILPDVGSVPVNGSLAVRPAADPTTYTLSCNGASDTVVIGNRQTVDLAAAPDALLPGESTVLYWQTHCADTCSFDQGIGDVDINGSLIVTPGQLPTTYTLTAGNGHNVVTRSVTISPQRPAVTFVASPALIKTGEPATLSWTTDRATACTIEPNIGDVPLTGSLAVAPDKNTAYTLTAIGPGGNTRKIATITYVKPTATIHADPEHLEAVGQAAVLTWVFSNADTCEIDQGIGEVQLGGRAVVAPTQTTTYTITATGSGGIAKHRVTVAYTRPTVAIQADREILDEGETATLTWAVDNADTCEIDQGIGEVQPGGSVVVDPDRSTTYTITVSGPGGRATDRVTVTCPAPTVQIQVDPDAVVEGQPAALTWQADHAATCVVEPDIGAVELTGSLGLSPAITTTYTVTASGRGGTSSARTTLAVINPPSITLIEPDGSQDNAHTSYTIRWIDRDPDSDAGISLYYDINDSGADGTLIAGGIDENPDGQNDTYVWDTTAMPTGAYYVYALIEDGINAPLVDYSDGAVTIDHAVTDAVKLTAGDGAEHDNFGTVVAIDGDYAVVGAPRNDDTGAAHVFKKEGSVWIEQFKLRPMDAAARAAFGTSVAISGDTVVVGAPNGNESKGVVYVFTREGSTWSQSAQLIANDGDAWDSFSVCVAIDGDTVVVGAPSNNDGSGAAYVFTRQGAAWAEATKLTVSDGAEKGYFGTAVSISGDTLIVGAPCVDSQTGGAFIFRRTGFDWVEETNLVPGDAVERGRFGTAVSINQNYAMVGNMGLREAMVEGAAYLFMHDGAAWVEQVKISGSSVAAGESFGRCVAIHGDMAVVGEPNVWNAAGAVYLFKRTGTQWHSQGGLIPNDGAVEDCFGDGVALDAEHIIVGASLDDDKGENSGSAYVYPLFSVSIDADPASIQLGGGGVSSTTLSWTSRGADSVRIDPDIGTVSESGSLTVSPQQTTTYAITGTKDGAMVTDSVTVAVIDPSKIPTVTISATPATIQRGAFATLAWSATEVDTVTLDNGIGAAPMTGSLAVFPVGTTTYRVTAANAGGTATASATIIVTDPLPTVELTVEPAQITAGESARLTWTATHADSASIQPGIGTVDLTGTLSVAPMQTTVYTITAGGSGGTATRSAAVTVTSPINIQLLSPVNGESVDRPDVMVHGTFVNTTDSEMGITVNGSVAMVYGNRFVANHVLLQEGSNTITVTATDTNGNSHTTSATINATFPEHHIRLFPTIVSGSSPLDASLHLSGTFSIQDATISHTGTAPVELIEIELDEYRVRMVDQGITYFTAEAVHDAVTYTDTIAVMVVDAAKIDALLQQKWDDMKTRLGNGDIPGAMNHFSEGTRPIFEYNFNLLNAHLGEIIAGMQSITLVKIEESTAEYNLVGQQAGQAFSFYLLFQQTADGTWRIVNF